MTSGLGVGELSVGPPSGVDPVGKMRLQIQNKQTNKHTVLPRIQHTLLYTRSTNVKEGCVLSTGTRTRTL